MITTPLLLGTGIGVGVWALLVWLRPPWPSLDSALAVTRAEPPRPPTLTPYDTGGWAARLGRPLVRPLTALGLARPARRQDLRILRRTPESLLAEQAVLAVAGLMLPAVPAGVLSAVGVALPWHTPLVAGLACAAGGFVLPQLQVRQQAERHRAAFRHAVAAYLNLVRICLAGGAGVDGALTDAASIGDGWFFAQIRRALTTARLTRITPWDSLHRLGEECDVRELVETAASVALAGTEGARVRASLAAKATVLRSQELTDAEGAAQAATERMSLPVVCLFGGFLLFIAYPAVVTVLQNF